MADERWTAETEELVARAEYTTDMTAEESDDFEPIEWTQVLPFVREAYLERARAGLTALADAGVLIPVGGETHHEWAVRVDEAHPKRSEKAGDYLLLPGGEQIARYGPRIWAGWVPVSRTHHIGPWREVTDDPA